MVAPADRWLGIAENRYSPGLREIVCRLSLNEAFVPASTNLKWLVQVTVSSSAIRGIVEDQGKCILAQQGSGAFPVGFTAEDCTNKTMITGMALSSFIHIETDAVCAVKSPFKLPWPVS